MYGYHGKILHIELGSRSTRIEEPGELFYWALAVTRRLPLPVRAG